MRHLPLLSTALSFWCVAFAACAGCATTAEIDRAPAPPPPSCDFTGSHVTLSADGEPGQGESHRLVLWTLEDTPELWRPILPSSPSLLSFRAAVVRLTTIASEPHGDHARAILEHEYRRQLADPTLQREAELNRHLLLDAATDVKPMRCFEALLFARQADRLDMAARPTEFLALVFRSADKRHLRVLEYTVDQPGIGRVGRVMEHAEPILASGEWHFWTALHNHNFFFGADGWHGGSVAPSGPDAQLLAVWRDRLDLAEYWITNGFSTSLRKTSDLD